MPQFKEIWYFSAANSGKWTEIFYLEDANLDDAAVFTDAFLNARLRLLGELNILRKIRVSQVNSPRVSTVKTINLKGLSGAGAPYPPEVAAVINLSSTIKPSSRRWWCRGLQTADVGRSSETGADSISPVFRANLKDFINKLKGANYIVLPLTRVGQGDVIQSRVIEADGESNDGFTKLTTDKAHGLIADDIAIISQASKKDVPGLSGKFRVISRPDATHLIIEYRTPENAKLTLKSGKIKKQTYIQGAIINPDTSGFSYLGGRQVKNDNTGSRGAKSAQRIRPLD